MKKIIFLLTFIFLTQLTHAQNDNIYYCTEIQNVTRFYCIPMNNDFDKNNISNTLAQNYNQAITFLDAGQNSSYINQTINNMTTIENFNNPTTAQMQIAIKQEATAIKWLYKHIDEVFMYIEWLYKFDKIIYGLI